MSFRTGQPSPYSATARLGLLPKVTLAWLLLTAVTMGVVSIRRLVITPSTLNLVDVMVIYILLVTCGLLSGLQPSFVGVVRSPISNMNQCTAWLSSWSSVVGGVHSSESLQVHG